MCNSTITDPRLEQSADCFLQYVKSKMPLLDSKDMLVSLMVDEIHLKSYMDFKGGNMVGAAFNMASCATSACVFMINSLLSPYKEVVHILPVKTLQANDLYIFIKRVILGLENLGFEVLVVVSDNHAVNRKAMSQFSNPPSLRNEYQHPNNQSRPLFYAIDSVHIFKNMRNNWINKKDQKMIFPDFQSSDMGKKIADFSSIKMMHAKEANQLLKYGYTLSLKALYPTSIERQNVKLALQVFNSNIVVALRELGPQLNLSNYEDTADYLNIICTWWDIVNVKTSMKGLRSRNKFQEPVTKNSHHIFEFLNKFLHWLDRWDSYHEGKLTRETHIALRESTDVYIKIANYCLTKKNFNYILLGQIQTDKLEERFGKYRYILHFA